jgi:SAM-dependent methyltransferase
MELSTIADIIQRQEQPQPWAEGEKIPWNDAAFSERMLKEHLAQVHDAASRRFEIIDRHVEWIHQTVLAGRPTRILDLGCGPGLYNSRLAGLGHECVGIDFSPASIAYARESAKAENLHCTYQHEDIRLAEYGTGYGLIMQIFGELNVFTSEDAHRILKKAYQALDENGLLVLEPHTLEAVRRIGEQPPSWYSSSSGLFSDRPHLCLQESFWNAERQVATQRYFIIDAATAGVTRHASSMQAYSDEGYRCLLTDCGFGDVVFYESLGGAEGRSEGSLLAIVARKR